MSDLISKIKNQDYIAFITQDSDLIIGIRSDSTAEGYNVLYPAACRQDKENVKDDGGNEHVQVNLYMEAIFTTFGKLFTYPKEYIKLFIEPSEFFRKSYERHLEKRDIIALPKEEDTDESVDKSTTVLPGKEDTVAE